MLIQPRRGTSDQWTSANPILAVGEMGYETDTRKFKYGNGFTEWNLLPYGITAANLSDASIIGVELLTAETLEEARTALGIGTGTSVEAIDIVDSTTLGRTVLTAATETAAQTALGGTTVGRALFTAATGAAALATIGAGTYSKPAGGIPATDLATTVQTSLGKADTALQVVDAAGISDATTIGRSILTGANAAAIRSTIGAGTSNLALGTTSTTALAGNYAPNAAGISDATTVGRGLITAATAEAARGVIGAGTSSLVLGTTSTTALAGNYAPTAANISDASTLGRSLLTAADAATARNTLGVTASGTVATVTAGDITDSTTVGRALLTATDAASARTALGAGTGTYSKPVSGIPSSDLATAVQTSLGLANSSLQSVNAAAITDASTVGRSVLTATDAAAVRTAISAGTYTRPGTGIPSTDLTTAIQTSLGKADTALQSVTSASLTDATATGRSLITATSTASALSLLGAGTYTKPEAGIPLNDLASSVQGSLGKAETALQSVTSATITDASTTGRSLIRTADAAAARTTIGAGTYSRPTSGIPSTDLTTSVQTSLGLANTALQTVPSGYVTGSNNGTPANLTLWTGTAAQYAAITTKSSTTVYIVT